jgi:hypothetical protein
MNGKVQSLHPRAQSTAYSLIDSYGDAALPLTQSRIDEKIREGDAEGALEMDQVRREVVALLKT